MPTNYELALFAHIVGVFGIAGAAVTFWVAMSMLRRVDSITAMRSWTPIAVWSDRAFPATAALVIIAGIFLVEEGEWGWGAGWMNSSLIALLVMGAGGGLLMTPRVGKIHGASAAAPDGAVSADLLALVNDPVLWGTLHAFTLALFAIIWNMTTKPTDAQSGMVVLLAFVVGAASALPMASKRRT